MLDKQAVDKIMQSYNDKPRKIRNCKKMFDAFTKWRNNLLNPVMVQKEANIQIIDFCYSART